MSYNQLILLCAAQAIAAIVGILWGVKRIHDMEKAAREMARGMTQLNTWDVDARIERLEGFREMVFRTNTKLGELEDRLSDHIKVFDGHARHNDEKHNVWSAVTHDLRRDMKEMRGEKESLRKLTEGTSIRITHAEAKLTAVADAVRELTPRVNELTAKVTALDDRISGAYKAAQEAHVAAASVGSELEKVRRMRADSSGSEDKALWSRMTEVLDRLNDIEKGFEAFITKGELGNLITDATAKEFKAVWAHITQIHQTLVDFDKRIGQTPATQVPLKSSRPIDDLAKEMLKQQQDQYIVVPADMGPAIEKMFPGFDVTEAIGKELGWSSDESPESKMKLRIAFLEKLVKNDVENLCQLEKKVDDLAKNAMHKADRETIFGHINERIKDLTERLRSLETRMKETAPSPVSDAVVEARRKDMWRSMLEIKKLAQTTKDNERHLSREGEDRMDHIVAVTDGLLSRLAAAGGSYAV